MKKKQHSAGRYLVDYALKNVYKIGEYRIIMQGEKPILEGINLHFSISHSNNIVITGFDNLPCGIDIEYMKERNFNKLSDYFNRQFN